MSSNPETRKITTRTIWASLAIAILIIVCILLLILFAGNMREFVYVDF